MGNFGKDKRGGERMTKEEAIKTWLPVIVDGVKTMPELEEALNMAIKALEQEPCYNPDEWCHDCREYDQEKHCCPRYNKVIRNTVEEIKQSKTGYWISYWDEDARCYVYKCPECGNKQPFDTKHCWECGTRLIVPRESEDKE